MIMHPAPQSVIMYRLTSRYQYSWMRSAGLTSIFNKYNPSYPYDYQFADVSYTQKFNLEMLIGKMAAIFAAQAIFISSLGLFGRAAYC